MCMPIAKQPCLTATLSQDRDMITEPLSIFSFPDRKQLIIQEILRD